MDVKKKNELMRTACKVRMEIVEGTFHAKSGHPGGSMSIADLLTYLYFVEMRIDPANPSWEDRDRLVLSKGHAAPGLYSALAHRGYFPIEELKTLRHIGSRLQGHPNMHLTPGVDMSTGSLGQGISAAVGMATGLKLQGKDSRVFAIVGDGEIEEGLVWEAAMFAGNRGLDNLIAVVDYNGLQIDGKLSEVNSPEPIPEKFAAFNWNVITIDAHNFDEIEKAIEGAKAVKGKPTVIVMKSIKGKGVSFMEGNVGWHGKAPNAEEYQKAMDELNTALQELEGK